MDKVREFLSRWGLLIVLVLLVFLNLNNCTSKVKNEKRDDKVTAIDSTLNVIAGENYLTEEEVKDIMQKVMLDFLISEQEIDQGKTTISDIKERIEND